MLIYFQYHLGLEKHLIPGESLPAIPGWHLVPFGGSCKEHRGIPESQHGVLDSPIPEPASACSQDLSCPGAAVQVVGEKILTS